ncbi:ninjurin-2-like [Mytilus galloprovincialis]|uniref:ninjurin-2-like n=1 Tax=Mytilus galloprovincialis TaxID=29158 RepID=UPI003F7CBD67
MASSKTESVPLSSLDNSSIKVEMDSPPDGEDVVEGRNTLSDDDTDSSSKSGPTNKFQSRREVTKGLYDVALLMANVSQLKSVLDSKDNIYYTALVCLLSFSISLHLISAILLYVLLIIEKQTKNKQQYDSERINKKEENQMQTPATESVKAAVCTNCFAVTPSCRCWQIYKIDIIATLCVFGVTVVNIFITAFYSSVKT